MSTEPKRAGPWEAPTLNEAPRDAVVPTFLYHSELRYRKALEAQLEVLQSRLGHLHTYVEETLRQANEAWHHSWDAQEKDKSHES